MNAMKLKLLEELLTHLTSSQGNDLKSLLDAKKPEMAEMPEEMDEDGKPKGIAIEKVSVMGKPKQSFDDKASDAIAGFNKKPMEDESDEGMLESMGGENEMNDEELEALLKKYLT